MWIVEPKVAHRATLVSTPAAEAQAQTVPNSNWIAYSSDVTGRREIYLAAFPGNDRRDKSCSAAVSARRGRRMGRNFTSSPTGTLVSVPINDDGAIGGAQAIVYNKPFGQSDPIARNYTIAPMVAR